MLADDHFCMGKALREAEKALRRGDFPVGCVIACDGGIRVRGSRRNSAAGGGGELDHAEMTALRRLGRLDPPLDPKKLTLYCTLEPCLMCFSAILLHGIGEIVYAYEDAMGGGTLQDRSQLAPLYRDSRVRIRSSVRRAESLALFKHFFANPENGYWRGSLLADYTLRQ